MPGVERPAGGSPRRVRRQRTEPPHVDHPIDAGHRLETKRRYRIEDRKNEADGVRNLKTGGKCERQQLTGDQQPETEMQQVSRQGWRSIQVSDVAFVAIEHTVDRKSAAI